MFCKSEFWDEAQIWNTTDPDFSPCFQKTVILWTPCVYLLLLTPFRILVLRNGENLTIPWTWKSRIKMVLALVISVLAACDIIKSIQERAAGADVPIVNFISPLVLVLTMVVYILMVVCERKYGVRSSGFLFTFWFLLALLLIVTFRSKIRVALIEGEVRDVFRFVTFFILYAVVLAELIITAFFIDKKNVWSVPAEDKKPCPEHHVSFLSQITFWWFSGLVVQGYKRALVHDDLWDINPEDRCKNVIPVFNKHWEKELKRCKRKHVQPVTSKENDIELKEPGGSAEVKIVDKECKEKEKECKGKEPRLFWAMVKAFGTKALEAAAFKLIYDILQFLSPLIMKYLIAYTKNKEEFEWRGYFYAVLMFVIAVFQSIILHQYFLDCTVVGMRLRTAIIGAVYEKVLKLSNTARKTSTVGEIVNLMSVDAQRFNDMMTYINMIWSGPVQIIISIYFLWVTLGPSIVAGIGVMIIFIPVNAYVASKFKVLQVKQMNLKDSRIKMMNEILNGIKVLKLYAWEPSFEKKVLDIRNKELNVLKKMSYLNSFTTFTWTVAPYLVSLVTFAVYVMVDENNILDAEKAFVSLALFNILRFPLSMVPQVISNIVQVNVSLGRLRKFLGNDELDPETVTKDDNAKHSVSIRDGVFSWDEDGTPTLNKLNLDIPEGSLVAVVGTVGTGKSSLLQAILGEMEKVSGSVNVKGSIAYVAQQAWIQNATLQDNILFGKKANLAKYRNVIETCALQADLEIMPAGDKTEIGEKGINLSGGQKQRVSLARAVYQDKDMYLLDDPLSAVDSHVGKHIFDNVIGPNGVLKDKTRILVTHGIGFLPQVDTIVVMVNGEISETGSYKELLNHDGAFAQFLKNYLTEELQKENAEELEISEDMISELGSIMSNENPLLQRQVSVLSDRLRTFSESGLSTPPGTPDTARRGDLPGTPKTPGTPVSTKRHPLSDSRHTLEKQKPLGKHDGDVPNGLGQKGEEKKLIEAEKMETERVKLSVFMAYLKSIGVLLSFLTVFFYCAYNAASVYSNIWLSDWSNDAIKNVTSEERTAQRDLRLGIYGLLGFVQGKIY